MALLDQTIELIKSLESEEEINSILFMGEVMTFLKYIAALNNTTYPRFNLDILVEKAFNHPLSNKSLQMDIV